MAVYITHHPLKKDAGKKMLWSVAGFGVCMILFGLSTNFYFSLVLLALSGALDAVSERDARGWFAHCGYPAQSL